LRQIEIGGQGGDEAKQDAEDEQAPPTGAKRDSTSSVRLIALMSPVLAIAPVRTP
jgi:hypothetical protein